MRGGYYIWWGKYVPKGPKIYYRQVENGVNRAVARMYTFRVVVGPDLLKERGIKMPKLGK